MPRRCRRYNARSGLGARAVLKTDSLSFDQNANPGNTSEQFRAHRSELLDCIRGVAIISVLIYHVATRYDYFSLDWVARMAGRYGGLGVDVFFPLSGFLITRYLMKADGSSAIKTFFLRRFFRIVPLYFIAVTLFWSLSLIAGSTDTLDRIWIPYTFLTGWFIFFDGTETVPYTITWSISVEEFAYILFGLAAWIARSHFPLVLASIAASAFLLRLWLELQGAPHVYNFPPARLDSIALGGLLAWAISRKLPFLAAGLALATVLVCLIALSLPALWSPLKYSFITLGTCSAIALFETKLKGTRATGLGWLASIGFYSYFTYLFHLFTIEILLELAAQLGGEWQPPFWIVVMLSLAITHTAALISFRVFEGPLLRAGRRLEP